MPGYKKIKSAGEAKRLSSGFNYTIFVVHLEQSQICPAISW